jgi:hypothetical protein
MTTKFTLALIAVALLTSFAAGRWSAPEKIKIQTIEVEKKTDDKKVVTDDKKRTTIVEVDKPDGTKVKTTVIADVSDIKAYDKITDDVTKTQTKEIDKSSSKVTISLLVAINLTGPYLPTYGVAITKPILGPITVGLFGLQDRTIGASVGLTF